MRSFSPSFLPVEIGLASIEVSFQEAQNMKINPIDKSALPPTGGDFGATFSSKQPGKTSQELS